MNYYTHIGLTINTYEEQQKTLEEQPSPANERYGQPSP